jgi:hypothetical protein
VRREFALLREAERRGAFSQVPVQPAERFQVAITPDPQDPGSLPGREKPGTAEHEAELEVVEADLLQVPYESGHAGGGDIAEKTQSEVKLVNAQPPDIGIAEVMPQELLKGRKLLQNFRIE